MSLIEEAANAMYEASFDHAPSWEPDERAEWINLARAAFAVYAEAWSHERTVNIPREEWERLKRFEQPHTPTSDEREDTWAHCSPALLAYGLDCAATSRRACACEPANGGHDHLLPQPQGKPLDAKLEWPDHWTMNEKLRDLHARWHDQPGNLIGPGACGWEGCEFWHSAQFTLRLADVKVIGREQQGEPTDAQVLAALNRYYVPDGNPAQTLSDCPEGAVRAMRAVLAADRDAYAKGAGFRR